MKEFDVKSTFYGIEQELDKYKMSTKNHGGIGSEILENDVIEITAFNATPDMDIRGLTESQIGEMENKHRIRKGITGQSISQQDITR